MPFFTEMTSQRRRSIGELQGNSTVSSNAVRASLAPSSPPQNGQVLMDDSESVASAALERQSSPPGGFFAQAEYVDDEDIRGLDNVSDNEHDRL